MKKKLKLSLIVLVTILLLSYITFPKWAGPLVLAQLPADIQITQLELGYPGLSGLFVRNLKLIHGEYVAEIDELTVNYRATDLVIDKVKLIQTDASDQKHLEDLALPKLSFLSIARQIPFQHLSVSELKFESKSQQVELKKLGANRPSEELINIEVSRLALTGQQPIDSLSATIELDENLAQISLSQAKQKLIDSTYQVNQQTVKIALTLFPFPIVSEQLNPTINLSEKVQLDVSQQFNSSHVANDSSKDLMPIKLSLKSSFIIDSVSSKPAQLTIFGDLINQDGNLSFAGSTHIETVQASPLSGLNIPKATVQIKTDLDLFPQLLLKEIEIDSTFNNLNYSQNDILINSESLAFQSKLSNIDENQLRAFEFEVPVSLSNSTVKVIKSERADEAFELIASIGGEIKIKSLAEQIINANLKLENIYSSQWIPSVDAKANLTINGFSLVEQKGNIQIQINDQDGSLALFDYQDIQMQGNAQVDNGKIQGTGSIGLNQQPKAQFSFDWINAESKGKFVLDKSEFQVQSAEEIGRQLLEEIAEEVSLIDGKLDYSAEGSVGNSTEVNGEFGVSDLTLSLDENQFEGFALTGTINKTMTNNQSHLSLSSRVSGEKIDFASGMQLSELSLNFDFDQLIGMTITDLSAKLFEGKITSHQLKVINNELQPSTLGVVGLSLTELVFFLNLEALFAEGNIDLTLPLQSVGGKLVIKDGQFVSQKPGIIKYDSGVNLNESENIALKALQNFQYTQLDGAINYDEEGNYLLKIHLVGANPDLYDGYPVDFTLNINGHLPGVFKSLFLTGSFEQSILESLSSGELEALQSQDN